LHAKATMRILSDQKTILKPVIKDLEIFMNYLHPDGNTCDLDEFAECYVKNEQYSIVDGVCNKQNGCEMEFSKLSSSNQRKIIKNWDTNFYDAAFAFNKMSNDIVNDVDTAVMEVQNNIL